MNPPIRLQYITPAAKNAQSQHFVRLVALQHLDAPDSMLSGIKTIPATGRAVVDP
jgi:hypothetical protein